VGMAPQRERVEVEEAGSIADDNDIKLEQDSRTHPRFHAANADFSSGCSMSFKSLTHDCDDGSSRHFSAHTRRGGPPR